jgi:hypothetical protein
MRMDNLQAAMEEAQRFLDRGNELLRLVKNDREMPGYIGGHPKQQGAVKRASMDLSRALADLRNPNHVPTNSKTTA